MHEDEEMTNLLYVQQQERKRLRMDVIRDLLRPHSDQKEKDHQYDWIQLLYWTKRCQGTCASEWRIPRFWAGRHKVKPSETLIKSCLTSAT